MPEVKCVTYRELADFMDQNSNKISDYQFGNFPKASASEYLDNLFDVDNANQKNKDVIPSVLFEDKIFDSVSYLLWNAEQVGLPSPKSGNFYSVDELKSLGITLDCSEGH